MKSIKKLDLNNFKIDETGIPMSYLSRAAREMNIPFTEQESSFIKEFYPHWAKMRKDEIPGRTREEKWANAALNWIDKSNPDNGAIVKVIQFEKRKLDEINEFYPEFFLEYGHLDIQEQYRVYKSEYARRFKRFDYLKLTQLIDWSKE